ncbi:MAG TPA: hypothetical protein VLT45_07030 [Kofleriaceae bacterium]|nr:hypothetical protein [Kofleriaceae bacterium]
MPAVIATLLLSATAGADARHVRIETRHHGPIHVWVPDGYDPEHAGVVVYVHGYFANVDDAWREYKLAHQFDASGLDAMFIACEAPTSPVDAVTWPSLSELLARVDAEPSLDLPDGPVIAVGHSGAHRTLSEWLDDPDLHTLVLLDALYGKVDEVEDWVARAPEHRLIDVSVITRPWAEQLHEALPETVVYDGLRAVRADHGKSARHARVVHVRARVGHMPLVTNGVALPTVLRTLRLPRVR